MQPPHKIIITGTGRNGTTFLVQLLTAVRAPTGYTRETWRRDYFEHCAAGLERRATDPDAPYIVKDPQLCVTLADLLARGELIVDHAIIPVRELGEAAQSRIRIGGNAGEVPGGLVGTDDPDAQRSVLAERFHQLVHTLVAHEVPHTFLLYPRFVHDADYAFRKLSPIFPFFERTAFVTAFHEVADPSLVHTYTNGSVAPAQPVAVAFRAQERRKRQWRRARRVAGWMIVAACLATALRFCRWSVTPPSSSAVAPTAGPLIQPWRWVDGRYRTWATRPPDFCRQLQISRPAPDRVPLMTSAHAPRLRPGRARPAARVALAPCPTLP